jgi:cytochrome c-type biogenesis protein CcmH/NrfG
VKASRIADQIAQVDLDLAEIDEQVEMGELDETTAERLRSAYRSERGTLEEKLDTIAQTEEKPSDDGDQSVGTAPEGRTSARTIAGTAIVGIAVLVVAVVAVFSLQEQTPAGEMTDGVATDVLEGQGGVDLSSITPEEMETVVAQNPDIPGMRVALAQRYLENGNLEKGLEHYTIALVQQPDDPPTNAWVGWLTFLSGDMVSAEPYVVRALDLEPDYPQAYWFLANIRFERGDLIGSVGPLERLLGYDLPSDVRADVDAMLKEARA